MPAREAVPYSLPIYAMPVSHPVRSLLAGGMLAYTLYYAPFMKNLGLWTAGVLFVYWFSVSGGMHNIIRGVPLYYPDQNGKIKACVFLSIKCHAITFWLWAKGKEALWVFTPGACSLPQVFMPQNQGQLGLEGFIMGMLYLLFGLSVAFLTRFVPRLASASHRRVLSYTCVAFAAVVFNQIVSIYTWKTGYRWRTYF